MGGRETKAQVTEKIFDFLNGIGTGATPNFAPYPHMPRWVLD